jgi:hypothetical protein
LLLASVVSAVGMVGLAPLIVGDAMDVDEAPIRRIPSPLAR